MTLRLKITPRHLVEIGGQETWSRVISVLDSDDQFVDHFQFMCAAIVGDIQNSEGSGACVLTWIEKIESGELDFADVDGNAWVMNITHDKVWFESLYSQGEGGEVTFEQYKLAVKTYVNFLRDPERKPVEIPFPE